MSELFSIRILSFLSVLIYVGFDFVDRRRVKDEREELIRLKSLELAHQATLGTLTVLALVYVFYPGLDTVYFLIAIVLAALYTEIVGKIYYRARL
jgi:hypothetical protein